MQATQRIREAACATVGCESAKRQRLRTKLGARHARGMREAHPQPAKFDTKLPRSNSRSVCSCATCDMGVPVPVCAPGGAAHLRWALPAHCFLENPKLNFVVFNCLHCLPQVFRLPALQVGPGNDQLKNLATQPPDRSHSNASRHGTERRTCAWIGVLTSPQPRCCL